jgi:DNA invertase Pin-like site-specific DNA recombinase
MRPRPPIRRCAIYTRKSSEEGLEQQFNSLDAQREAALAYIKSQQHEGWRALSTPYDDGGFSGGTLERPGLQRLIADIRAGKVQIVVVYKVDRLTRSLADFAKLIEVFETRGVSFVSVTQQFNTTTSMGRLMLNVLLSFAQFEREVAGERIRDKIAASKKKGLWMGGTPPLGYDVKDRTLVVNETEAALVRLVFESYVRLGTVTRLMQDMEDQGHRTKRYVSATGATHGGVHFSRGHLYRILANRIYRGEIVHKDAAYPGEHAAIVDEALWERAQALLAANRHAFETDERVIAPALLKGLLFDGAGNRMSPSHAVKQGQRYRYYVSQAVLQNREQEAGAVARVPAQPLEAWITDATLDVLARDEQYRVLAARLRAMNEAERYHQLRQIIQRVVISDQSIMLRLDAAGAPAAAGINTDHVSDDTRPIEIELPFDLVRRTDGARIIVAGNQPPPSDASALALTKALVRGYRWRQQLMSGSARSIAAIAKDNGITARYVSRLVRLSLLAPDVIGAILTHHIPGDVTLETLPYILPHDWDAQRRLFGVSVR